MPKNHNWIQNITEKQILQEDLKKINMNDLWKFKQGELVDVYFLPAYCRLNIQSISKISYENMSALLDCKVQIGIKIEDLDAEIVSQLLKCGIRLSFNVDEESVDLNKKNKNVNVQKTSKLLCFTINEFITANLRIQDMILSPFNLINCELIIRLNRVKLQIDKNSSVSKKNESKIENIDKKSEKKKQNSSKSRKQSKTLSLPDDKENIKKIEIHFNFMDHMDTEMKIQCSGEDGFGEFFIAFNYLNAAYSNKSVNLKDNDEEYKQQHYTLKGLSDYQKIGKYQGQEDFETQAFLVPEQDQILKRIKKNRPDSFDFAHFTIPLYKRPIVAILTIFLPLFLLGCLNLGVFFQQGNLHKRIVSIGGMLVGFVGLVPPIKQQMPDIPRVSFIEYIVLSESLTTVLALIQSLIIGDDEEYKLQWQDYDGFFLAALIMSIINFSAVLLLIILYLVWKKGYIKGQKRFQGRAKIDIDISQWSNKDCDAAFEKFNRQGIFYSVKEESESILKPQLSSDIDQLQLQDL